MKEEGREEEKRYIRAKLLGKVMESEILPAS